MTTDNRIYLTEEKETLFITLYAKAFDSRSQRPILNDSAAAELLDKIDLDLSKYNDFGNILIVTRAKQFDEWIKEFIKSNSHGVIVYLGCGLDTRISRINPPDTISWFDIDYPDVMQLRKKFFVNRNGYTMIESSLTDPGWMQQIPTSRRTLIIAEGVLEYIDANDVKTLFNRLLNCFEHGELVFDVMNSFAIKSGKQKLKKTTGAEHKWAVDDLNEVDHFNKRLKRISVISVFKTPYTKKLPFSYRVIIGVMGLFPAFRNMMRFLRYRF